MNIERTISIRKTVRIAEGFVSVPSGKTLVPCHGRDAQRIPAGVQARDITCTITVDVPVLTEYPSGGLYRSGTIEYLHEHGFGPDDEIGLLAGAVPGNCKFRMPDDVKAVYRCARINGETCGFAEMSFMRVEDGTPVVVRVRDILPGYQSLETK
jgi:hypothetical protein